MTYYKTKKLILRALPILIFTCFLSVLSGQILGLEEDILKKWPLFLILIPSLLKIGGDTGCMMGARLSSALHFGISKKIKNNPVVINNFIATLIIGFVSFLFVSIIVWIFCLFFNSKNIVPFKYILFCSSCVYILDIILVYITTIILSFLCHKYGYDPDDIVIPLTASLGDIAGVLGILISIVFIGVLP